jgi:hypothetical protein
MSKRQMLDSRRWPSVASCGNPQCPICHPHPGRVGLEALLAENQSARTLIGSVSRQMALCRPAAVAAEAQVWLNEHKEQV